MSMKVTYDIPDNLVKALNLVAETLKESVDEWAAYCLKSGLESETTILFQDNAGNHYEALSEKVERLINPESHKKEEQWSGDEADRFQVREIAFKSKPLSSPREDPCESCVAGKDSEDCKSCSANPESS